MDRVVAMLLCYSWSDVEKIIDLFSDICSDVIHLGPSEKIDVVGIAPVLIVGDLTGRRAVCKLRDSSTAEVISKLSTAVKETMCRDALVASF